MRYKIIPWKTDFFLVDGQGEIEVGDFYYTSLEHDEPIFDRCKVIDKENEYWLDNQYKYTFNNLDGALTSSYGSAKIIACTARMMGDKDIPQLDINEIYPLGEMSTRGVFVDLSWITLYDKNNLVVKI